MGSRWLVRLAAMIAVHVAPGVATRVTLIRHGQTEWNVEGRIQGSKDSPLTAHGRAQAEATAARVKEMTVDAFYCSHLPRAAETATIIAKGCACTPVHDERLRERNFGMFEGMTREQMAREHPSVYDLMLHGGPDYAIPGGESKSDVLERALCFLNSIHHSHRGQHVLVVSHGATLNVLSKHVLGLAVDAPLNWEQRNLGMTTVVHDGTMWKMRTFGDVSHLEELGLE